MPAIRRQESWSEALRTSVRSSTAKGWNVYEFRGQARLELRQPGVPKQTVILPFDWAKASVGDALTRVRNIYPLVAEDHSLKAAAEIADGKAPKPVMDWAGISRSSTSYPPCPPMRPDSDGPMRCSSWLNSD